MRADPDAGNVGSDALARESELLSATGMALVGCQTPAEVVDALRDYFAESLPDALTMITESTADGSYLVVRAATGLDATRLARLGSLVGFGLVGKRTSIRSTDHDRAYGRSLVRVPGGFCEFVLDIVPQPVARVVEKAMGFCDAYVIGITDGERAFGNVSIVTTRPGVELPKHGIESIAYLAFLTFARIDSVRALRESEARYRVLTESMGDVVSTMDLDTLRFTYVSPSSERLCGYLPEEIMAEPMDAGLTPEGAAFARRVTADRARDRRAGVTRDDTFYVDEVEQRCKDGTSVWTEVVSAYHLDEVTGRVEVRAVTRDISKRKAAGVEIEEHSRRLEQLVEERTADLKATNEDLARANDELRVATEAKSAFLASMSHELRTPLNSIIGFSGILSQGLAGPLNAEQKTQVDMVHRSGRHLLSLIDDVLDLSKIEAGHRDIVVEPVDAVTLVHEVIDAVRPLALEKGLSLDVVTGSPETHLRTDAGKLRQVLFNLLGNAVKFTDVGGVAVTVSCSATDGCTFAIADTGPGIPAADIPRIFEAFTQLEAPESAKAKGTGLGLRISSEYARLLGGAISVTSEPGEGSTFTLVLPNDPPSPLSTDPTV